MYALWIDQDQRYAFGAHDNGGVEISSQDHAALMRAQGAGMLIQPDGDGQPVAVPPRLSLYSLIIAKQAEIRDGAEAVLAPLKAEYGPTEIASWETQKEEAKALLADPDAEAPYIRSASATRGMDPLVFAARVIANNAAWATIGGHVGGQRLAYQDALDAAAALPDEAAARAAIAAIVPVYTLPG